jgi:hypothetical protein
MTQGPENHQTNSGGFADESNQPPDLQEWVARYGGYQNIPWDLWDAAVVEYQTRRRERP